MATLAAPNSVVAEYTAKSVIREFQKSAPVNVVSLAERLGLHVWVEEMPDDISGKIIKDTVNGGSAGYSVIVNEKHVLVRQRFTVAHEIGHFLLHRQAIGDGLTDDALLRSGLSTLQEVQANKMAADILMPFPLIEAAVKSGVRTIEELAVKFQVSRQAMAIRTGIPE
jgi:predicted transcriptional regulator